MCCPLYTSELHMSCIFQMLSLIYFTNENIEVNGVRKGKKCTLLLKWKKKSKGKSETKQNEILRYVARENPALEREMRQLNIFDTTKETSGISIIRNSRFQTDIYKLVWIRDIENYLNSKI